LNELIRQFVDIVASRCVPRFPKAAALGGEVTRLNSTGQFKPFVYLNGRDGHRPDDFKKDDLKNDDRKAKPTNVVPDKRARQARSGTHTAWSVDEASRLTPRSTTAACGYGS